MTVYVGNNDSSNIALFNFGKHSPKPLSVKGIPIPAYHQVQLGVGLWQKIEIYFNFIGEYIPPAMAEIEPTPEELEEIRKKEARKDRLHQNYLKRKANGKQKEYEERIRAKKKAQIDSQKEQIRAEDSETGSTIKTA